MNTRSAPTQPIDLVRIAAIGEKLRALREELIEIFPEREDLINQAIFALLTREHMLIYGTFGTGKSDLVQTLFHAITDAELFSIEMTKFTPESQIIGPPSATMIREKDTIWYNRESGMLNADLAEFDELLDATPALLRTLLGIMNERIFKRGRQVEAAKLMTAIASTNADPAEEIKHATELGAVIDRFLFKAHVDYLTKPESRRRMYAKFLNGQSPSTTISIDDLRFISDIVVGANQITDPHFIEVYDQVIEAVRAVLGARGAVISDRTACKVLQLVEANAALNGRYGVVYEDIYAIRWALCLGGNKVDFDDFFSAAKPIIAAAIKAEQQSVDQVMLQLMAKIKAETPDVPTGASDAELVGLRRLLGFKEQECVALKPEHDSTRDEQDRILELIRSRITEVDGLIAGVPM